VPEFLIGWVMIFVGVAVAVGVVVLLFRDNVVAYTGAAFCVPLLGPVVSLLTQPSHYYRWNGVLLLVLILVVLGWLLAPGRERQSP